MGSEEEYHVVKRGDTIYVRRKPGHYRNPSAAQEVARAVFGVAAYRSRDRWGRTRVRGKDGAEREVVLAAKAVQEEMRGVRIAAPKPKPARVYKFLGMDREQLRALVEALARAT